MEEFTISLADEDDAQLIYNMMVDVYEGLEDKSIFACADMNYVKKNLSDRGFSVIAYDNKGKAAGTFIFEYPGIDENNLGRDIDLPECELSRVVHMDTVVVLPEYRGNGLQKKMLCFAEEFVDKNKYRYFMATASPSNKASLNTFLSNGYRIMKTKLKYGGLLRAILLKTVGDK